MSDRMYEVFSPTYTIDGAWGPPETTNDWALVKAPNAKAAKWAAHRLWHKQRYTYWRDGGCDTHPLSKITAVLFVPEDGEEFDLDVDVYAIAGGEPL